MPPGKAVGNITIGTPRRISLAKNSNVDLYESFQSSPALLQLRLGLHDVGE